MENPFRANAWQAPLGLAKPCVMVIFGATGDLTERKLIPALYNLAVDGLLPANFNTIGFARREWSEEFFHEVLHNSLIKYSRRKNIDSQIFADFAAHSSYLRSSFDDSAGYLELRKRLEAIDQQNGNPAERVFYLATTPEQFEIVVSHLAAAGLLSPSGQVLPRVVVEKPFGQDLSSAKKLNQALLSSMVEKQIYRIDHYLGKETVQNLLVFRFANGIFEPLWNRRYVDFVEISVCESIGVGSRGAFYDSTGILRDIVQNHVLQLLSLVALEAPVSFAADAVRDEKVKVLRSVRPLRPAEVADKVLRAQYSGGVVAGEMVPAYREEGGITAESTTETYVALELAIDSWRWAGVPFFIRAGKRLPKRVTEIAIHFRKAPLSFFPEEAFQELSSNVLSFQIQPDEGISLKIGAKPPGPAMQVQPVQMAFSYDTSFSTEAPEAYERLLLDSLRGDVTLFTRTDEIEQAWSLLDPLLQAWSGDNPPPLHFYQAGSWGPEAADAFIRGRRNRGWRRL